MEKNKCNYWDTIFQGLVIYRAEFQCASESGKWPVTQT